MGADEGLTWWLNYTFLVLELQNKKSVPQLAHPLLHPQLSLLLHPCNRTCDEGVVMDLSWNDGWRLLVVVVVVVVVVVMMLMGDGDEEKKKPKSSR